MYNINVAMIINSMFSLFTLCFVVRLLTFMIYPMDIVINLCYYISAIPITMIITYPFIDVVGKYPNETFITLSLRFIAIFAMYIPMYHMTGLFALYCANQIISNIYC